MKKVFAYIPAFLLVFTLVFSASGFVLPQVAEAQAVTCEVPVGTAGGSANIRATSTQACVDRGGTVVGPALTPARMVGDLISIPAGWLAEALGVVAVNVVLKLASLLTYLSGIALNWIVRFSIMDMASIFSGASSPIYNAWSTIRDIANMGFIFILLYAAIKTILGMGDDNKKLIVRVVIVAILINFSLFVTRVVIDASNVLAIFFYDAIAPGALTSQAGIMGTAGVSNILMNRLGAQTLFSTSNASGAAIVGSDLIIIGVMGSIVALIAAFVFFAAAIMFIVRIVVLVFVMVLSPIAFIAFILPGLKTYGDQWKNALLGQAFFAPIFFLLLWIVIVVANGLATILVPSTGGTLASNFLGQFDPAAGTAVADTSSFGLLVNYFLIIGMLIAALIISKQWANKAGPVASGATKWLTGAAGGAVFGTAGWASRNTIGRAGQAVAESETLKKARDWSVQRGGLTGATLGTATRFTQSAGKKVGASSLDMRGSALGGSLDAGKAGGKGGYEAARKEAAKREKEYAESLAPSEKTKAEAKIARKKANEDIASYQKEYDDAVRKDGPNSVIAQWASRNLEAAKKRKADTDKVLGNKDEIENTIKSIKKDKDNESVKIRNDEDLKAAELAERSAQDTVNRLEAEAKGAIGSSQQSRLELAVETAKENLRKTKEVAKEARRTNQERIRVLNETFDDRLEEIKKKDEILPAGETRKENHAKAVEKSPWAKLMGYNYAAAATIRKGDKTAKDLIDEALKKTGEKSDQEETKAPETPPTPAEDSKAA